MRSILAGLLVAGLLVVPTFGAANIDVQVLVNGGATATVAPGSTVTVAVQFKATAQPVVAVGGDVTGTVTAGAPTATFVSGAYTANFQGFQPVLGDDGITSSGTIPPSAFVAAANGGLTAVGTAQNGNGSGGWLLGASVGQNAFVTVLSYTITVGGSGTIQLQWTDVPLGYSGWYTTDKAMNNGITANNTAATITVSSPVPAFVNCVPDGVTSGNKTLWRNSKNTIVMNFAGPITAPTAGQLTIKPLQASPAPYKGADVSASLTMTASGSTLTIQDPGANLVPGTWYAIENNSWTTAGTWTEIDVCVFPGDVAGNGAKITAAADVNPVVAVINTTLPATSRKNMTGASHKITAAADVNPVVAKINTTLAAKPAAH